MGERWNTGWLLEKYRPKHLDEIVGNGEAIEKLKSMVGAQSIPPLILLHGPRGVGKSSAALIFSCDYFRAQGLFDEECRLTVPWSYYDPAPLIYRSASNIDDVDRDDELINFVRFNPPRQTRKIAVIDEAERLSKDNLSRLVELINKYSKTPITFILIMDTTDGGEDGFQWLLSSGGLAGEPLVLGFKPLKENEIMGRLKFVAQSEGLSLSDDQLCKIARESQGSMVAALIKLEEAIQSPGEGGKGLQEAGSPRGFGVSEATSESVSRMDSAKVEDLPVLPQLMRVSTSLADNNRFDFAVQFKGAAFLLHVELSTDGEKYEIMDSKRVKKEIDLNIIKEEFESAIKKEGPLGLRVLYNNKVTTLKEVINERGYPADVSSEGGLELQALLPKLFRQVLQGQTSQLVLQEKGSSGDYTPENSVKILQMKILYESKKWLKCAALLEYAKKKYTVIYLFNKKSGSMKHIFILESKHEWDILKNVVEELLGRL